MPRCMRQYSKKGGSVYVAWQVRIVYTPQQMSVKFRDVGASCWGQVCKGIS